MDTQDKSQPDTPPRHTVALVGDSVANLVAGKLKDDLKASNVALADYTVWGQRANSLAPDADRLMEKIKSETHADLLLLSLGGNDLLNQEPLGKLSADLGAIVKSAHAHGMSVAMVGIDPKDVTPYVRYEAMAIAGPAYVNGVKPMFEKLARENGIACHFDSSLYAGVPSKDLAADNIHPNLHGQQIVERQMLALIKNAIMENAACVCPAEPVAPLRTPDASNPVASLPRK